MASDSLPPIGARVVTSDGEIIGNVANIVEPCFKVDKPLRTDQWMGLDLIDRTEDGDVMLNVSRADLEGEPEGIEHFGFHVHRES